MLPHEKFGLLLCGMCVRNLKEDIVHEKLKGEGRLKISTPASTQKKETRKNVTTSELHRALGVSWV